jgi:hypothetical protein
MCGIAHMVDWGAYMAQQWRNPMLTQIGDLPPNILGIEASGQITHEDYQKVLIPKAEAMMVQIASPRSANTLVTFLILLIL